MYILASKSPRRQELLKHIISDFKIIVSNVDENKIKASPYDLPLELSKAKAKAVFINYPNDVVIAADTVVIVNNEVLGKPINDEDAKRMLHLLSKKTHDVVTGFTIISKEKTISKSVLTKVTFNELSDELINTYVKSGSPKDKAGAYGIQDKNFPLIKNIEGSYYNVVGLPLEELKKYL